MLFVLFFEQFVVYIRLLSYTSNVKGAVADLSLCFKLFSQTFCLFSAKYKRMVEFVLLNFYEC